MFRHYYINEEWMVSGTARRIYRAAASLSLGLFIFLVAVRLPIAIPESLVSYMKLPLFIGVLGAAITMVAMQYFLFGFDDSSASKKALWFCVMIFVPLGPALYCFIVYSRSQVLKANIQKN